MPAHDRAVTDAGSAVLGVSFAVDPDDGGGRISLCGELDDDTSAAFAGVVDGLLNHGCADLTVDLSELTFFDLRGFASLCAAQARLRERGGRVRAVRYDRLFETVVRWWGADDLLGNRVVGVPSPWRSPGPADRVPPARAGERADLGLADRPT